MDNTQKYIINRPKIYITNEVPKKQHIKHKQINPR